MPSRERCSNLACLSGPGTVCGSRLCSDTPALASGSMGTALRAAASAADKKFVMKAMQGGMAEVQLGQLATQKGIQPGRKGLRSEDGRRSHQAERADEARCVAARDYRARPRFPPKDQALMTKLQGLSGAAFDKAYITAMVADHKEDDKEFKSEETSAKNPQVKRCRHPGRARHRAAPADGPGPQEKDEVASTASCR